ncbi:MAG: hypothetical protein ABI614_09150 [Planctomycetota bacterium]
MSTEDNLTNAVEYAERQGISLECQLGYGNDGTVWSTSRDTAVKALFRQGGYDREIAAYRRLEHLGVGELEGFTVPRLVGSDDSLFVIEMTIVFPPCILDFAKSYVDEPPDFSEEVLADWRSATEDLFGDKWSTVNSILGWLRSYGIFYFDAKPSNIRFESQLSE